MSKSKTKTDKLKSLIEFQLNWLQKIFNTLAMASLVAVALVVLYQIVGRYLPFLKAPVWTVELSKYLFIYIVVLSSCAALVSGRHVKLELYQDKLSDRSKLIYSIITHLVIAAFCIILIKSSWDYTANGVYEKSPTLEVKMTWFLASTMIFFVLSSLTSLLLVCKDVIQFIEKGES